jgi:hypothetical protein
VRDSIIIKFVLYRDARPTGIDHAANHASRFPCDANKPPYKRCGDSLADPFVMYCDGRTEIDPLSNETPAVQAVSRYGVGMLGAKRVHSDRQQTPYYLILPSKLLPHYPTIYHSL